MRPEEKILIKEIRKRNKAVFESIFREYCGILKSIAYNYTADIQVSEDIVQDFFAQLWKNADHLYFDTSIKAYFIQSIKNRCHNYLRDLKIKDKHEILYLESILSSKESSLNEEPEIFDNIRKIIKNLPPEISRVILLKYFEGKKIDEIALLDNLSPNTVKKRLQKAKELLKKKLEAVIIFILF